MSILKQVREFLDQFNEDLDEKAKANEILKEIQEEGFTRGVECTGEHSIKALDAGTIQTIHVSPNQIQIFMDEGDGYLIENNLMPLGTSGKRPPAFLSHTIPIIISMSIGANSILCLQ